MFGINEQVFLSAVAFGLGLAAVLSIATVGFTLQFAITRILNIGYGAVLIGAAFVGYVVKSSGGDLVEAGLAAVAFGSASSVLLGRFIYRPFARRVGLLSMLIVTLSVSIIVEHVFAAAFGGGFVGYGQIPSSTYGVGGFSFTVVELVVIALAAGSMLALHLLLRWTRLGKAMRATADNEALARGSGIPVDRIRDLAWLLSGLLCGLGGFTFGLELGSFESTSAESFLVVLIAAAVIGGIGNPYGAMLASLFLGLVEQLGTLVVSVGYQDVLAFGALAVVLVIRRSSQVSLIGGGGVPEVR